MRILTTNFVLTKEILNCKLEVRILPKDGKKVNMNVWNCREAPKRLVMFHNHNHQHLSTPTLGVTV